MRSPGAGKAVERLAGFWLKGFSTLHPCGDEMANGCVVTTCHIRVSECRGCESSGQRREWRDLR